MSIFKRWVKSKTVLNNDTIQTKPEFPPSPLLTHEIGITESCVVVTLHTKTLKLSIVDLKSELFTINSTAFDVPYFWLDDSFLAYYFGNSKNPELTSDEQNINRVVAHILSNVKIANHDCHRGSIAPEVIRRLNNDFCKSIHTFKLFLKAFDLLIYDTIIRKNEILTDIKTVVPDILPVDVESWIPEKRLTDEDFNEMLKIYGLK